MTLPINKLYISLTDFYQFYITDFYQNNIIKQQILNYANYLKLDSSKFTERVLFNKIIALYFEEAELTLSLLVNYPLNKQQVLLEIGSGLGLVYAYLQKQGYNIHGVEPSDSGFNGYYEAAVEIFKILNVDSANFYPITAQECTRLNLKFDIIFSNNVLEHVPDLEPSLVAMKRVLKPNGIMIHNTVNYFVPYEPHFKIFLVPFFPRLTERINPKLKEMTLWNSLNFINTYEIQKMCKKYDLNVVFEKDKLKKTFLRLEQNPAFAERQKMFFGLYQFLKFIRAIQFIDKIPIAFTTPIAFKITHKGI